MKQFPLMTAHTGCMGHPDHSLASLHAALALGADVYEDDIRATRDGRLVLAHDDEVRLADGRQTRLSDLTLEELDEQSIEERLSLESVLRSIKEAGRTMNLDIKSAACLEPAAAMLLKMEMTNQAFFSGCEYPVALEADRCARAIRKLLNVNIDSFLAGPYAEAVARACDEGRASRCFGLNVPYQLVRPELVDAAKQAGLAVYVWTVSEPEDMRRMAGLGVDSITTRNVAELLAVKNEAKFSEGETVR
ncbi:glycerophosphodiester phosphodiesterase [Paenibacillus timonensis]|uniref:Glycerophosphodiester phosphodiesterase n=3 Tax=Paenibacillus TaxID=44249 RepID=A0ABW3S6T8_9BACL|nr:glycerophosphodiester phosphodiesterase family protein [Paenibacillus timonensis]MCH1638484.1 glycerophosphodiester phosphodiesterase [Paenibacillus timonensis]